MAGAKTDKAVSTNNQKAAKEAKQSSQLKRGATKDEPKPEQEP